jgi:hypothetical protein
MSCDFAFIPRIHFRSLKLICTTIFIQKFRAQYKIGQRVGRNYAHLFHTCRCPAKTELKPIL